MSKLQYDSIEDFMRDMETRKAKFEQQTESVSLADLKAGKLPAAPEAKLEPGLPPEPEEATPPNVQTSEPVQVPEPTQEPDWIPEPFARPQLPPVKPWVPPTQPKRGSWVGRFLTTILIVAGLIWYAIWVDNMALESCMDHRAMFGGPPCDGSWNGETKFVYWFPTVGIVVAGTALMTVIRVVKKIFGR